MGGCCKIPPHPRQAAPHPRTAVPSPEPQGREASIKTASPQERTPRAYSITSAHIPTGQSRASWNPCPGAGSITRYETIAKLKIRPAASVLGGFHLLNAVLRSPARILRVCADCDGGGVSEAESGIGVRGSPGRVAGYLDAGPRERFWFWSSTSEAWLAVVPSP